MWYWQLVGLAQPWVVYPQVRRLPALAKVLLIILLQNILFNISNIITMRMLVIAINNDDESMCFLSDEGIKLFLRNNAVLVKISSLDHFLKDGVVSQFSQILSDLSQILESNESCINESVPVF